MKSLAEKIAVMEAAERGEKIESKYLASQCPAVAGWIPNSNPAWDWGGFDYRVAPRTMKIAVVAWKSTPNFPFVITKDNYENRYDIEQLLLLSTQTITY